MPRRLPSWLRVTLGLLLVMQVTLPYRVVLPPPVALADSAAAPTLAAVPAPAPAADRNLSLNLDLNLDLRLTAEPTWVEPGDVVTFTVAVANPAAAEPVAELVLRDPLPDGLSYVPKSAQGFEYSAPDQQLTWAAGPLAAGAVLTGSFQARVQGRAIGATLTNTVTATDAAAGAPVLAQVALDVVSPRNNEAWATPDDGGLLRSTDDRVLLRVPPGAVKGRVRFTYQPQAAAPTPPAGLRFAFSVTAQGEAGQPVQQFAVPLTLAWAYPPAETPPAGERLTLTYFDETTQTWTPLTAQGGRAGRQVRAVTSHLTLFAAVTASNFVPEVMPSLRGIQSDRFTGAASVAYAIPLPPGRGGLTPELGLQFNSQSRQADAGHASVVGTGWKLSADSFIWWSTAPATWRIAGSAYTEQGGPNGRADMSFLEAPQWRLQEPEDAYAPDGTRYHFEEALNDWWCDGTTLKSRADKWVLQYVVDPLGNRIDYIYDVDLLDGDPDSDLPVSGADVASNKTKYQDALGPLWREAALYCDGNHTLAYLSQINLKQIRYNGGQTVVDFTYAARTDAAAPFCEPNNPQADPDVWGYFSTRLLTGIRVRQGGQLVTGYQLAYDHWGPAYCAAGQRYALKTLARCSDENLTSCLPGQTYTNTMPDNGNGQMGQVANGYGGQVAFGYGADGVVVTRTVTDTVTGTANQWGYSYAGKLPEVGYAQVTETLPSSLGAGNTIYAHFLNGAGADAGFRGKEDQQIVTAGGVKQQEVGRTWLGTCRRGLRRGQAGLSESGDADDL